MDKRAGKYAGKKAREVDEEIIKDLASENILAYKHPYTHDYPICWRCKTPLLQINIPQWFFKVTDIREDLLKENEKIKWFPGFAGARFKDWLENLGDWPISRQRYWGTPLPIWFCGKCDSVEVIGSFDELKEKSGLQEEIDFHKPDIDGVQWECECGSQMKRVPDVMDVWFDAGVGSWASLGYPRDKHLFEKLWPTQLQIEGPDQFRGWWNAEMITSYLTFGQSPFNRIIMHGLTLDLKGAKMSKSIGNIVAPEEVTKKHGRDALRLYLLSLTPWNNMFFSWDGVADAERFLNVFWNTFEYLQTYAPDANVKSAELQLGGLGHSKQAAVPLQPEDKWIISKCDSALAKSANAAEGEMHVLANTTTDFILNDLSRWYIKIVRDRLSPGYGGKDKAAAQYALHYCMRRALVMLAPITPFVTEKVYQELYSKADKVESMHMLAWPAAGEADAKLEGQMEVVKLIVEAANAARQTAGAKLRWPVDKLTLDPFKGNEKKLQEAVQAFGVALKRMCNCKEIVFGPLKSGTEFGLGKLSVGKPLMEEALLRELTRSVQQLRKEAGLVVGDRIELWVSEKVPGDIARQVGADKVNFGPVKEKKGSFNFEGKEIEVGFRKV